MTMQHIRGELTHIVQHSRNDDTTGKRCTTVRIAGEYGNDIHRELFGVITEDALGCPIEIREFRTRIGTRSVVGQEVYVENREIFRGARVYKA